MLLENKTILTISMAPSFEYRKKKVMTDIFFKGAVCKNVFQLIIHVTPLYSNLKGIAVPVLATILHTAPVHYSFH